MTERMLTYIGFCCREWILAAGFTVNRCGYCGQRPEWLRRDDYYDQKEAPDA